MTNKTQDDLQNYRLPLYGSTDARSGSTVKDQRFINCIPESITDATLRRVKTYVTKRSGLETQYTLVAGEGRNADYFNGSLYTAIDGFVYKDTSTTPFLTLSNATGHVGMVVGNSIDLGEYLFICDGDEAWVVTTAGVIHPVNAGQVHTFFVEDGGTGYTTATATITGGGGSGATAACTLLDGVITDVDIVDPGTNYTSTPTVTITGDGTGAVVIASLSGFPSPHQPTPVWMDGYVFLPRTGSGDINNSWLEDPRKWPIISVRVSEMYPDNVVSLARHNNQIIAFGDYSTEFFYDNANISGSPIDRNEGVTIQVGCAAPYATSGNELYTLWVAQSKTGGRAVWIVDGFKGSRVSDESIDRILDAETDMGAVRGFGLRTKGHFLYVINLPTANRTLVFDTTEKVWSEWSSWNGSSHDVFRCNYIADNNTGRATLLDKSSGVIYELNSGVFEDGGNAIRMDIITLPFDADTLDRKFLTSLGLVGDSATSSQTIYIRWSDDDCKTWSTPRSIDLGEAHQSLNQCGQFRRRHFNVYFDGNADVRLEFLELSYRNGIH